MSEIGDQVAGDLKARIDATPFVTLPKKRGPARSPAILWLAWGAIGAAGIWAGAQFVCAVAALITAL
jgi:hypothetical protein